MNVEVKILGKVEPGDIVYWELPILEDGSSAIPFNVALQTFELLKKQFPDNTVLMVKGSLGISHGKESFRSCDTPI